METQVAPRVRTGASRFADTWVFLDGELVRYHDAYLPPMTHALHYGTGCFEGIRAYWNQAHEQLYLLQAEATELDHRQIGTGAPGHYTRRIQDIYFRAVRGDEARYTEWLVPVYG